MTGICNGSKNVRAGGFWAEKANALLENEIFDVYSERHLKHGINFPPPTDGLYIGLFFH